MQIRTVVVCEIVVGSMPPKSHPPSAQSDRGSVRTGQASFTATVNEGLTQFRLGNDTTSGIVAESDNSHCK